MPSDATRIKEKYSLLASGALFTISTTIVNLGNYLYNLVLGRWLGPTAFADLSLVVTLMLVSTFISTSFMVTTAKFIAVAIAEKDDAQLAATHRWLWWWGAACGTIFGLVMIVGSPFIANIFHLSNALSIVALGIGMPILFILSIERGVIQGEARFVRLAICNQAEMWTRLGSAILLVWLGLTQVGPALALSIAFVASYLTILRKRDSQRPRALRPAEQKALMIYIGPVIIGLLGQIIINNCDVLIVKGYFPSTEAGMYSALALIGRIVFFATWSIVTVMFPLVAQRQARGEEHRSLLWISMGIVLIVSGAITLGTLLFPNLVITILFGPAYLPMSPLIWQYALATTFYALANVIVNYYLSLGKGAGNLIILGGSIVQIVRLFIWHQSLAIVVQMHIVVMGGIFVALLLWHIRQTKMSARNKSATLSDEQPASLAA
jgi:O-antigen/teichoic acid export membrane protein